MKIPMVPADKILPKTVTIQVAPTHDRFVAAMRRASIDAAVAGERLAHLARVFDRTAEGIAATADRVAHHEAIRYIRDLADDYRAELREWLDQRVADTYSHLISPVDTPASTTNPAGHPGTTTTGMSTS